MNVLKQLLLGTSAAMLAIAMLGMAECGPPDPTPTPPPTKLQWYYTCGDPVCQGYTPKPDVPKCTTEQAGASCTKEGATCDPVDDCNRLLICAASDPTQQPGGCPISQAAVKRDIHYLNAAELQQYRDELLNIKLATWQYNSAPAGTPDRLGFIIDDAGRSPAVLPNGKQVDVYGYSSLTVAALQVQAQELEALKAEIGALKKDLEAQRAAHPACKQ